MVEFLEVIKKVEYPEVLVLDPKTSKGGDKKFCGFSLCEKTPKTSRGRGLKNVCTQPPSFFSGIVCC